jgi:hypothetical protein
MPIPTNHTLWIKGAQLGGGIVFVTGVLKVLGVLFWASRPMLNPVIPVLTDRELALIWGLIELCVAYYVLRRAKTDIGKAMPVLAWMSTVIGVYRLGIVLIKPTYSCNCFGLVSRLFLNSGLLSRLAEILLLYLLIVSYAWLLLHGYFRIPFRVRRIKES